MGDKEMTIRKEASNNPAMGGGLPLKNEAAK
jgi:hypothetical protein